RSTGVAHELAVVALRAREILQIEAEPHEIAQHELALVALEARQHSFVEGSRARGISSPLEEPRAGDGSERPAGLELGGSVVGAGGLLEATCSFVEPRQGDQSVVLPCAALARALLELVQQDLEVPVPFAGELREPA